MDTRKHFTFAWRFFVAVVLTIAFTLLGISQSKVGTTAAQFLGMSVGPRAIAMGGAYVASAEDATSLFWNPGAFAQAGKTQAMFSNTDWLVGSKFRWFGLMLNLGDENAVGLSLTQLDYGEDDVTTVTQPDGTGERWSAQDLAISGSYCRRLTDRFSMGGSVKYVSQQIWNESASTFAFDLGLLYVTGFNDMRLGASLANFGGDLRLDGRDLLLKVDPDPTNAGSNKSLVGDLKTDSWPIPLLFRVGVAMDVVKNDMARLTVAADALRPTDNNESVNLGGELGWREMLFVRGGYQSAFAKDQEESYSLGGGVRYNAEGVGSLQVDYAFTKFGAFGNLNTFALTIGF